MRQKKQVEDIEKNWTTKIDTYLSGIPPSVFNKNTLTELFWNLRRKHLVPYDFYNDDLLAFIIDSNTIKSTEIKYAGTANPKRKQFIRYILNSPSPFSVALSIRSKSYLSHNSALYLHGLTEKLPQEIIVNKEQSAKPSYNELTQDGINRAFKNNPKKSRYIWKWSKYRLVLINGKNTDEYGVINHTLESGEKVRITDLERTLVDIVVRPIYSGGAKNFIDIYRRAKDNVSTEKIVNTLEELDYTYPYHQSIGFLMERAGYESEDLEQIRALGIKYDFYLEYNMKKTEYDHNWRLYYPKGMK